MKVYLAMWYSQYDVRLLGVFSTEEKAKNFFEEKGYSVKNHHRYPEKGYIGYAIEECFLDKEFDGWQKYI